MNHGQARAGAPFGNLLPGGRKAAVVALALLPVAAVSVSSLLISCVDSGVRVAGATNSESCMLCHNGSQENDYAGTGIENPHPFPGASNLLCTTCHGGNPDGVDKATSHVPPPPQIGDRYKQERDALAYFNRLTLTGVDKLADYTVGGVTYSAIDWLQFVNPGDLRVTERDRGCGQCHGGHSETVAASLLATDTGILGGAMFAAGIDNAIPGHRGLFEDTATDVAFRAVTDPTHVHDPDQVGVIGELVEHPVHSQRVQAPDKMFRNQAWVSTALPADQNADGTVQAGSRLAALYQEQVAFTCGDCHLGSAGANNRYGDFRSSGCTACHMPYSLDGRSRSRDPNVDKTEPLDPDDIDEPERAHVKAHRISNIAKTLPDGTQIAGIDDYACAGCHQGSNRTVMQYWGIRLDQNQDLRNRVQYPANPVTFRNTANDRRLFDRQVRNNTFNGRNANQYILFEDYDGDQRDDTPADVHYEAGLGCIDCHGSYDLHGGDVHAGGGAGDRRITSRMEQSVAIQCENCHGGVDSYAPTIQYQTYDGRTADVVYDGKGNPQRHVERDADGHYWLTSRLTGQRHYVPQTRDIVVDSGRLHPTTQQPLYSPKGSYAMGRADGLASTGTGPQQTGQSLNGFCHSDSMSCASCHAAWTNTCMGCHLVGEYDEGNNFSNITGERIVFQEKFADFVYQSPVFFQLGVDARGRIAQMSSNTKVFFSYEDINNNRSRVFAFSDRKQVGNNPSSSPYPSMSHNAMMAHSIRGRVNATDEGPRYCVACHLTTNAVTNHGAAYDTFRTAMAARNYAALDFNLLKQHIGQNPGNQIDSPLWVHAVAGLGSGLFLFDDEGCPQNPLDTDVNRKGCNGVAPATRFDVAQVRFDLDRIVESDGRSNGSNNHQLLHNGNGPDYRDGAQRPRMAGPLGARLIQLLADPNSGLVLNAWLDADGALRGDAGNFVR